MNNKVYEIIAMIPKGRVATYGQIADLASIHSPRYIGYLLHNNPSIGGIYKILWLVLFSSAPVLSLGWAI